MRSQRLESLLALLADGEVHSGEVLGERLGISRAAVWKRLRGLQALGLPLQTDQRKGYRLTAGTELLNSAYIRSELELASCHGVDVYTCLVTDSTNDWVRTFGPLQSGVLRCCLSEYQTCGRGRRGRVWRNAFGATVNMSLLWQRDQGTASLEGLSLAVAVAVVRVLADAGIDGLQLKWPNDVLWDGRKLCGILLEVHGDPNGTCEVVIGIGLNVSLTVEQLEEIDQPAVDVVRAAGGCLSRNKLVVSLICELRAMLDSFHMKGFQPLWEEWSCYDVLRGKDIVVSGDVLTGSGRCLGIDSAGGLLVESAGERRVYTGGEVSLRLSDKDGAR